MIVFFSAWWQPLALGLSENDPVSLVFDRCRSDCAKNQVHHGGMVGP